jgi:restriction system protein
MGRRRESTVDVLLILPWWVSAALAGIAYVVLKYAAPSYFSGTVIGTGIGNGLKQLTPLICGVLLVVALASFIRSKFISRKYDRLTSVDGIRSLPWRQFEAIVGEAFRRRGYGVIENAVDGPDGGVDLVLRKDGERFFVQCKQWKKSSVGVKPVRELFGVISAREAAGGFFVCSGSYTEDAKAFAKQSGIELIDGEALQRMIEVARTPEPFLDPTESKRVTTTAKVASATPPCPSCGSAMTERVAKRGANAGSKFWGCTAYPKCRGTRVFGAS